MGGDDESEKLTGTNNTVGVLVCVRKGMWFHKSTCVYLKITLKTSICNGNKKIILCRTSGDYVILSDKF